MTGIKRTVKKLAVANATNQYKKEVKSKNLDYNAWVRMVEKQEETDLSNLSHREKSLTNDSNAMLFDGCSSQNDSELAKSLKLCKLIEVFGEFEEINCKTQYVVYPHDYLPQAAEMLKNSKNSIDAVIFTISDGTFSEKCFERIYSKFAKNKNLIMIYSDEDVVNDDGYRSLPWYKSDWAPDTFKSFCYFGSMIALKSAVIKEMPPMADEDLYTYLYRILLAHNAFSKITFSEDGEYDPIVGHIPSVLYHTKTSGYEDVKSMKLNVPISENCSFDKISVVIPSKDHPEVLGRCIDSFLKVTDKEILSKVEFVVVDNGSSDENKKLVSDILNFDNAKYIYEKRDFNFSYMCNLGAKNSTGDYLLFLNDDMEIVESDWLKKLMLIATQDYTGCVGAKLLYPESSKIQHAGITNLRIGPAHKIQFMSDEEDIYFGKNRFCQNVIGVTGACLLISKSVFEEVGGFDEKLAVAFNDVDLCFKVFEHGYYNTVRCDTILYHHESLSRGNDSESEEKLLRLNAEKDYLYLKHTNLYGKDPFYNVNLTTDMWECEYAPKYHYEVKLDGRFSRVKDIKKLISNARYDKCVRLGMESAMDIYKWKYGVNVTDGHTEPKDTDLGYYFQGYAFVIGSDNACFEKTLFLENTETKAIFGIETQSHYRPDIKANLSDQLNVDLTGFTAKITADSLPEGKYRFGLYVKDKTSSLRLYNYSNWTLNVNHFGR